MPPWARFPGAPEPTGTLFIEAFGQLSRDTNLPGNSSPEPDLYIVFSALADLMGWSTTPGKSSSPYIAGPTVRPLLWWMHEAELTVEVDASRIGYVQVGLEDGVDLVLALPALIQCFNDSLRRFGNVELTGLQVTASHLQPSKGSSAWNLVSGLNWFNTALRTRADAHIAFDDGLLRAQNGSELATSLGRMSGGRFEFGPLVAVPEPGSIKIAVEAPIHVVLSPAQRGVSVKLPEWTASTAAWALAILIDTARAAAPEVRNFAVRVTRAGSRR